MSPSQEGQSVLWPETVKVIVMIVVIVVIVVMSTMMVMLVMIVVVGGDMTEFYNDGDCL